MTKGIITKILVLRASVTSPGDDVPAIGVLGTGDGSGAGLGDPTVRSPGKGAGE